MCKHKHYTALRSARQDPESLNNEFISYYLSHSALNRQWICGMMRG